MLYQRIATFQMAYCCLAHVVQMLNTICAHA